MDRATMIKDFKKYINDNRDKIMSCAVDIKDLPQDDEWETVQKSANLYINKKEEENGKII